MMAVVEQQVLLKHTIQNPLIPVVQRFRKVMHLQSVRSRDCSAEKKLPILLRNVMTLVQVVCP